MAEKKTFDINIKFKLKNMPLEEYEAIMKPYRTYMLQFERSLRQLADAGVISYKILDTFTSKFKFAELQRERFTTSDEQDYGQQHIPQQTTPQPQTPQPQQSGFTFNQPQSPQPQQAQPQQTGFGFGQNQPASTGFSAQSTAPRPQSSFETSRQNISQPQSSFEQQPSTPSFNQPERASTGFNTPSSQPASTGFESLSDKSTPSSTPSFTPSTTPSPSAPSFGLSGDLGSSSPTTPAEPKVSIGVDEEDRATGIAILRKKMLMELRKIRNVVEQEDDSNF